MKTIIKPVSPKLCEKVISGECTLLLSKTRPKLETPFKEYIYCTKGNREALWYWKGEWYYDVRFPEERPNRANGKVIGEFVCDKIDEYRTEFYEDEETYQEIREVWFDEDYDYPVEDYRIITTNERENPSDCKLLKNACLTFDEVKKYVGYGDGKFYAWHISELKIYDKPKELREFYTLCEPNKRTKKCDRCEYAFCTVLGKKPVTRAPKSWCYVEELEEL